MGMPKLKLNEKQGLINARLSEDALEHLGLKRSITCEGIKYIPTNNEIQISPEDYQIRNRSCDQ